MQPLDKKQDKKQEIHDAALRLFAYYGYKKTTLEDVAAAVGMTKSNIYFYFANKKTLYEQTVANALENWRNAVAAAVAERETAIEKFMCISTTSIEYIARHESLQAILIQDPGIFTLSSGEDRFHEINLGAMKIVENIIQQGIDEGVFHAVDVAHATEFLFSIYLMFLIKTYVKSERSTTGGIYMEGLSMLVRGLCKEPAIASRVLKNGLLPRNFFNQSSSSIRQ